MSAGKKGTIGMNTCQGKILSALRSTKRPMKVSEFISTVGYKAGTRLNELVQKGLVKVAGFEGRFALYALTATGGSIPTTKPLLDTIHIQDTTSPFLGKTNIPNPNYKKKTWIQRILGL